MGGAGLGRDREVEQPHLAVWRRGEPDDLAWRSWWSEMLRGHRAAGRTCRRARVVSEPLRDYQRWTMSHAEVLVDAGKDIRYLPRHGLATVGLPGSGDFDVFDDEPVLFLPYAGSGTNTTFEVTATPGTVLACRQAFENVWDLATPFRDYRPD